MEPGGCSAELGRPMRIAATDAAQAESAAQIETEFVLPVGGPPVQDFDCVTEGEERVVTGALYHRLIGRWPARLLQSIPPPVGVGRYHHSPYLVDPVAQKGDLVHPKKVLVQAKR